MDELLKQLMERLNESREGVKSNAQSLSGQSGMLDNKDLQDTIKDVVKGYNDLAKALKSIATVVRDGEKEQKQAQRVLSSLNRQRVQEEKREDAERKRGFRVMESLRRQRVREEERDRRERAALLANQSEDITMGRLPLASVPAMMRGNASAGARVGYALGEHLPVGKWGGLALGAGIAGGIGAGFSASPMGADVVLQPLKVLAGTIGTLILPSLYKFGAALLDVADWIESKKVSQGNAVGLLGLAAAGFGAYKGLGAMAAGGVAGGAMGNMAAGGMAGLATAGGTMLKSVGKLGGIGAGVGLGLDMMGEGSNAGKFGKFLMTAIGGALGFLTPIPGGAGMGAAAGYGAASWLGLGDAPAKTGPSKNQKLLLDEMMYQLGGRPSMGTDLTQIQKDAQMAVFESPMEIRLRQTYMEGVDRIVKSVKGD
jgi:hypothetical protein